MKVHLDKGHTCFPIAEDEGLSVRLVDWGIGVADNEYFMKLKPVYRYWLPPHGVTHTVTDRPYRAIRAGLFSTMVHTTEGEEK